MLDHDSRIIIFQLVHTTSTPYPEFFHQYLVVGGLLIDNFALVIG